MSEYFLFPYKEVKAGSVIAIYGAGNVGNDYYEQIVKTGYCEVYCVFDKSFLEKGLWNGITALPTKEIKEVVSSIDALVLASSIPTNSVEMLAWLKKEGVPSEKIIHNILQIEPTRLDSYSQHGEDRIIFNAFMHMGYFRDGKLPTYIDVGAHDPYALSNTALFHKKGCYGVNIEANPELAKKFEKERPNALNLSFGVGAEEGTFPFYICGGLEGLSTLKPENIKYNEWLVEHDTGEGIEVSVTQKIDVPVYTLPYVIEKYCNGVWPDFMSIDIEGMEYESLEICDLRDGPKMMAVEVNFDGDLFIEMMDEKGYFPYLWYRENILFVRKDQECLVHEHSKRD